MTEREEAANDLGELERQRASRMEYLIAEQRLVAEANRQKAARELEKFGEGDQG